MRSRFAAALLALALTVLPLAFGGVLPWSWAPALVLLTVAVAVNGSVAFPKVGWVCAGVVTCLLVIQLAPLPETVARTLSPAAFARIQSATPGGPFALSLDRTGTLEGVLLGALYVAAFIVSARVAQTPRHGVATLVLLVGIAAVEALYGLSAQLGGTSQVLGVDRPVDIVRDRMSGTYVNPNHCAGLLAMALPVAAVLLGSLSWTHDLPPDLPWSLRLSNRLGDPALPKRAMLGTAAALIVLGLATTRSRGGLIAAVGGVTIAVVALRGLGASGWRSAAVIALCCGAAASVGSAAFEQILLRLGRLSVDPDASLEASGRLTFVRDTLTMALDYPLCGVGLGAFEAAYADRRPGLSIVPHAHCDYAQVLAEFGLIGGVALLIGVAYIAVVAWRRSRSAEPVGRVVAFASLTGVTAIAVHSLVDFNLRIPANALWASALLGLAWGSSIQSQSGPAGSRRALLPVALIGAASASCALAYADWIARPTVQRSAVDDRPVVQRLDLLEASVSIWPFDATRWADLAMLRRQRALALELSAARATAEAIAPDVPGRADFEALLLEARLPSSEQFQEALVLARTEAEHGARLAPGDPRIRAVRDHLQSSGQ